MSAVNKLIAYILTFTQEQIDEVMNHQPMDGKQLSKDEYIAKIIVMLKECNDIPLIDLIHKLLIKSI